MNRIKVAFAFVVWLFSINSIHAQSSPSPKIDSINVELLLFTSQGIIENDSIIPVYEHHTYQYKNIYTGECLSNTHFQQAYPFYKGFGVVMLNGKFGVIDRSGNYVVPLKQRVLAIRPWWIEFISSDLEFTYFGFDKGLLEKEPYYDDGEPVTPSLVATKTGGSLYIYKTVWENFKRVPTSFIGGPVDSIIGYKAQSYVVKRNGKIGLIGRYLIEASYSALASNSNRYRPWNEYLFALKKGRTWFYFYNDKLIFSSRKKANSFNDNAYIYPSHSLFNFLDSNGIKALQQDAKWISANGKVVMNTDNQIVLIDNKHRAYLYRSFK